MAWEEISCVREVGNYRDLFAVAVVKSGVVVGHVPSKISSVFLRRGGTIDCRVTGGRHFSEDLPQGGLEIPCTLTLRGTHSDIDKVKSVLFHQIIVQKRKTSHPKRSPNVACLMLNSTESAVVRSCLIYPLTLHKDF